MVQVNITMPELLNISHAADYLSITRPTLYLLIAKGRLKTVDIDGAKFILKADLDNFKVRAAMKTPPVTL